MTTHQRQRHRRHASWTKPMPPSSSDSIQSPANCTVSTIPSSVSFSPTASNVAYSKTEKHNMGIISPRMNKLSRPFVVAMDCFFILVVIQVAVYCFVSSGSGGRKLSNGNSNDNSPTIIGGGLSEAYHSTILAAKVHTRTNKEFQADFVEELPLCDPLQSHEVSYSLVIPLQETDLHLLKHHCKRWGIHAPISIAVYTSLSTDEVMTKIQALSKGYCHVEQLSITTLLPTGMSVFPMNELMNLAIQGASTTHIIPLDVHMWSSMELHETLHTPKLVQALANDPKLLVVLPAFEVDLDQCSDENDNPQVKKCEKLVPRNYDDLIVHLGQKEIFPMNPENYAFFGSTRYREWVTQPRGQLLDIECVSSSNQFRPFVVARRCQSLPPFQEIILSMESDDDDQRGTTLDDSTWIAHLIRLGYRMKQIGGEFVVYMSAEDQTTGEVEALLSSNQRRETLDEDFKSLEEDSQKIRRRRKTRDDFWKWLGQNVPDHRVIQACEDS